MTQEKRNIRLLISLAVLVAATIFLYWYQSRDNAREVNPDLFKVADLKSISTVKLTSATDSIQLSYNGIRWMVNDKHPADTRMIQVLFATLQQVEPRRPVASAVADSISTALEKKGVTVSLFEGEQLVRSFVAGGNESKTQAFFRDNDGRTYIVAIPGYKVYASGVFELSESGFRDKFVFGFNWRNFKSLKAEFAGKPSENFEVSMGKDFFTIRGMAAVDTARLNTYLDKISLLKVDEYLPLKSGDSLAATTPWLTITIADLAERKYELSVFQPQAKNKVIGLISREPALFNLNDIREVVRPRSFFVKH